MNIRDLEYLTTLARLNHFGKAAAACHVSQPTLSMQIKKLEQTIGVDLFERGRRSLRLTPAGEQIVERAEAILKEVKAIHDIGRQHVNPFEGQLTLGAFPTLAPFVFPRMVPGLNERHAALRLFLIEEKSDEILRRLRSGKLDMALLALPVDAKDLDHALVFEEPFMVAVSIDHPLARKKSVPLEQLRQESILLLEDSHCLTGQALEVCTWLGSEQNLSFRATSIETLRQMVASNLGVTLVPRMAALDPHPQLAYLRISSKQPPGRKIALFWRKSAPFAKIGNILAQNMKEILEND